MICVSDKFIISFEFCNKEQNFIKYILVWHRQEVLTINGKPEWIEGSEPIQQ